MSDIQQANIPASTVTLLASGVRTASAAGTAVTGFAAARLLVLQLEVTAASGTLPTLDVIVEDTVDGTYLALFLEDQILDSRGDADNIREMLENTIDK